MTAAVGITGGLFVSTGMIALATNTDRSAETSSDEKIDLLSLFFNGAPDAVRAILRNVNLV